MYSKGKAPLHSLAKAWECSLVCKIQISKYLRFFVFLFKFFRERRGCFWGVLKVWLNMQHTGRLSAYAEIYACKNLDIFLPPTFFLNFSFSPYRSLGRGEDSRHRKNVAKLLCAFKPKCLHNFFCLSTDKSIVDISAPKFWCFFKNRCHRWECPTLAGLTSTPFRERSLGKQVVFGLLASLLPTRDVVII